MTVSGAELGRIDINNVLVCSALKNNQNSTCNYICLLCIIHFTHFLLKFGWETSSGEPFGQDKTKKDWALWERRGLQANSTSFNSSWSMETNKVCLKSPGPQAEELQLSPFLHQHGGHPLKPAFCCLSGTLPLRWELLHCLSSLSTGLLPFVTMPVPIWN